MNVSVIVASIGRPHSLRRLLECLAAQDLAEEFEVTDPEGRSVRAIRSRAVRAPEGVSAAG